MKKRMPRYEHLSLDIYWTGRPWYRSPGVPIKESSGMPRDISDLPKLAQAVCNALVQLGADDVLFSNPRKMGQPYYLCERCGNEFVRARISAHLCPQCRTSY